MLRRIFINKILKMSASGDTVYLFRALLFTHPSPLRRVEKGASGEAKVGGTGRHTDDRINKEHRERTCVSASRVSLYLYPSVRLVCRADPL